LQAVGQRVAGELLEQGNHTGLIVYDLKLIQEPTSLFILRYAFVTRGPGRGDHIFPAFILDDWGREIHSLKLYRWVRENGERFPRAEIFGYEQDGRETQCFLRELELYARLPCYAFHNAEEKVSDGRLVKAIFLRDVSATEIQKIARPPEVGWPLRYAHVSWWQFPVNTAALDLSSLDTRADPGY
jgi:hypothetical protein